MPVASAESTGDMLGLFDDLSASGDRLQRRYDECAAVESTVGLEYTFAERAIDEEWLIFQALLETLRKAKLSLSGITLEGQRKVFNSMCPHPGNCIEGWNGSVLPSSSECLHRLCHLHCGELHGLGAHKTAFRRRHSLSIQETAPAVRIDSAESCCAKFLASSLLSSPLPESTLLWDVSSSWSERCAQLPEPVREGLECVGHKSLCGELCSRNLCPACGTCLSLLGMECQQGECEIAAHLVSRDALLPTSGGGGGCGDRGEGEDGFFQDVGSEDVYDGAGDFGGGGGDDMYGIAWEELHSDEPRAAAPEYSDTPHHRPTRNIQEMVETITNGDAISLHQRQVAWLGRQGGNSEIVELMQAYFYGKPYPQRIEALSICASCGSSMTAIHSQPCLWTQEAVFPHYLVLVDYQCPRCGHIALADTSSHALFRSTYTTVLAYKAGFDFLDQIRRNGTTAANWTGCCVDGASRLGLTDVLTIPAETLRARGRQGLMAFLLNMEGVLDPWPCCPICGLDPWAFVVDGLMEGLQRKLMNLAEPTNSVRKDLPPLKRLHFGDITELGSRQQPTRSALLRYARVKTSGGKEGKHRPQLTREELTELQNGGEVPEWVKDCFMWFDAFAGYKAESVSPAVGVPTAEVFPPLWRYLCRNFAADGASDVLPGLSGGVEGVEEDVLSTALTGPFDEDEGVSPDAGHEDDVHVLDSKEVERYIFGTHLWLADWLEKDMEECPPELLTRLWRHYPLFAMAVMEYRLLRERHEKAIEEGRLHFVHEECFAHKTPTFLLGNVQRRNEVRNRFIVVCKEMDEADKGLHRPLETKVVSKDDDWAQGFCCSQTFESRPERRPYAQDEENRGPSSNKTGVDKDDGLCCKNSSSCANMSSGLFLCFCSHRFPLAQLFMPRPESVAYPFELIRRWSASSSKHARVLWIYDNVCKLHKYILYRDPRLLFRIRFCLDRFHLPNHVACNTLYGILSLMKRSAYEKNVPLLFEEYSVLRSLDTQAAEQNNKEVRKIATQLAHMSSRTAQMYVNVFLHMVAEKRLKDMAAEGSRGAIEAVTMPDMETISPEEENVRFWLALEASADLVWVSHSKTIPPLLPPSFLLLSRRTPVQEQVGEASSSPLLVGLRQGLHREAPQPSPRGDSVGSVVQEDEGVEEEKSEDTDPRGAVQEGEEEAQRSEGRGQGAGASEGGGEGGAGVTAGAGEGQSRKRKRGRPTEANTAGLPPEGDEAALQWAFHGGQGDEILFTLFNAEITRNTLRCLLSFTWLNDEVINLCLDLMAEDDKTKCELDSERRPTHFFNSHFLHKLTDKFLSMDQYVYANVKRWTQGEKVVGGNVFECGKVIVPVNIHMHHWYLVVIDMEKKVVQCYDSKWGKGDLARNAIMLWLQDEHVDKLKTPMDMVGWQSLPTCSDTTPWQKNGYDCGVFTVSFARCIYEGKSLKEEVREEDMGEKRNEIARMLLKEAERRKEAGET